MNCPYGQIREIGTTADTSLRVEALSLAGLFQTAAWGFTWLLISPDQLDSQISKTITIYGTDPEILLLDWLNELLFLFDTAHLLFRVFDVELTKFGLTAKIRGCEYNPRNHALLRDIKAVTWHGFKLIQDADRYSATILFDL